MDIGLVEILERDMPKKTYYKVNEMKVYQFLIETDFEFPDVKKFDDKMLKNLTPSSEKIEHQDIKKFNINNNINNNKNNNNIILSNLIIENTDMNDESNYENVFKKNIEYDILIQDEKNKELIKNITSIVVETLNSKKEVVFINGESKPINVVKNQFLKLKSNHIQYVINCLQQNNKEVKSVRSYVLTTLYNSINTMDIDITLQVSRVMRRLLIFKLQICLNYQFQH